MISSYDRNAARPTVGTLWAWEPETALALVKVTSVLWNGEEWFVGTRSVLDIGLPSTLGRGEVWNDLSRFWEACHYVAANPGVPGTRGATRRGVPEPEELGAARSRPH